MKIPSWTYKYDLEINRDEYINAVNEVFDSGRLLFGKQLKNFEKSFSSYIGTKFAIGCDNATNAIFLSLKSIGVGEGDEVITVPNTAIPTVSAICQAGAKPVFVDVNKYALMDVNKLEEIINHKTKAIIPVHLYGFPCDMDKISLISQKYNIHIIEDCSQAHGTILNDKKVGTFGRLSCFSFYPTKSLGGFGDAGIICTNDPACDNLLKKMRFYGIENDYVASINGYNSRMDEIHAAILNKKLTRLEDNIKYRNELLDLYISGINSDLLVPLPKPKNARTSNYLLPFIFNGNREKFLEKLSQENIGVNISYKHPIHTMPAYKNLGYKKGDFKKAEFICDHIVSLPICDYLPKEVVYQVIKSINLILKDDILFELN